MAGEGDIRDPQLRAALSRASALVRSGRAIEAVAVFQQILPRIKSNITAMHQYAVALYEASEHDKSITQFQALLKRQPMNARLRGDLATVLIDAGRPDEALQEADRALAVDPSLELVTFTKATAMRRLGRVPEAELWIEKVIGDGGEQTFWHIAACVHIALASESSDSLSERAVELGAAEAGRQQNPELRRMMLFQLAELCDRMGRYADAFDHATSANALRPTRFDHGSRTLALESMIESWRQAEPADNADDHADGPIFIVGMPRSGTSLVEQILAAHPKVAAGGERLEILRSAMRLKLIDDRFGFVPWSAKLRQSDLAAEAATISDHVRHQLGAPSHARVTDKLPANILRVGYILTLFPSARIVVCERDPRDTCLSCFFQDFPVHQTSTFDLQSCAHDLADTRFLAEAWSEVFPGRVRTQSYERLVAGPEPEIRALLDFVDLPFDDRCLSHHKVRRRVVTQSYDQASRPIYTGSIGRWKNYEGRIADMIEVFRQRGVELP